MAMEDYMTRAQIPAFGNWDYCDEMPITQYFETAMQAGLIRAHYSAPVDGDDDDDTDLFTLPVAASPVLVARPAARCHKKGKKGGAGEKKMAREQQLRKQQGKVYDLNNQSPRKFVTVKAPKAVDEDLYKIPPDLLYQKPKKKRLLRNLWSGCLGLNCCVA